ncbi:Mitochondrial acidic protein mam33 [Hypsizygus marmoreus]|uniref:Mitochondrial acidic protein mam33 n=1 Tax=Hypsizygus marmoreus TaxID=39966 RepID=A0A369K7Q9_HYPMA|nr:Mitochondrial acidic protein mam33 [Hypsizygus marmoreus]
MSALRTLRQLTSASSRVLATRQISMAAVSRGALRRVVVSVPTASRAFSVSARRFGEGTTDIALSQKLQEELNYEKEANAEQAGTPDFLKAFLEQGVWELQDTLGQDEVTLTRKFGNENLRLMFSIADIEAEEEDFETDEAPKEEEAEAEEENEPLHSYPIRASLSITKTTVPGCLNVDMVCQEGHFIVDNISYYKDATLGTDLTAEADWKRRGLYIGPQFDTLDVAVQEEFERYLQERGVNEHVALFIPEYAEFKEQKEYVKWLTNVKSFVDQ